MVPAAIRDDSRRRARTLPEREANSASRSGGGDGRRRRRRRRRCRRRRRRRRRRCHRSLSGASRSPRALNGRRRPRTASVAVVVLVVVARGVFRGVRGRGEEAASRGGGPRGGALRTRARVPRGDDDRRECRVGDARGSGGAATPSVRVVPVPVPVVEGVGAGVTIRHLLGSGGASVLGSGSRGCHGGDARFVVLRAVEVDHSATPRHGFDVRGRDSPAARVGTYDVRATGEISRRSWPPQLASLNAFDGVAGAPDETSLPPTTPMANVRGNARRS